LGVTLISGSFPKLPINITLFIPLAMPITFKCSAHIGQRVCLKSNIFALIISAKVILS
jgi:hypothetical protein